MQSHRVGFSALGSSFWCGALHFLRHGTPFFVARAWAPLAWARFFELLPVLPEGFGQKVLLLLLISSENGVETLYLSREKYIIPIRFRRSQCVK